MEADKRVVVTGAGGFLGAHICSYLAQNGFQIAAIGRFSQPLHHTGADVGYYQQIPMELPDKKFTQLIEEFQPSLLVHCASSASVVQSVQKPYDDFRSSVDICASILDAVRRKAPDCKTVLLSSAAVYGNPGSIPIVETAPIVPISPYGYHKWMGEILADEYAQLYGLSIVVLRIFSAYGEGLRRQVVFDLCKKNSNLALEEVEVYGTGAESRDFIHAQDIARAVELVYRSKAEGCFNVASGVQTKIAEIVELVKQCLASSKAVRFTGHVREGEPLFWQADISKLSALGFSTQVALADGIGAYCRWFAKDSTAS
jgi:UDP-glucose 4-epimerase